MKILGLELKDFLTVLLALYGALVTTVLAVWKRREYIYRVAVFCDVESDDAKQAGEAKERFVMVRAVNDGHRTLEIIEIGFKATSGRPLSRKFSPPTAVEPGRTATARFDSAEVLARLDSFTEVFAEDSAKHLYKSSLSDFVKKKIRLAPLLDVAEILVDTVEQFNQSRQVISDAASELLEHQQRQLQDLKKWGEERARKHEEWDKYRAETGKRHPEEEEQIRKAVEDARAKEE